MTGMLACPMTRSGPPAPMRPSLSDPYASLNRADHRVIEWAFGGIRLDRALRVGQSDPHLLCDHEAGICDTWDEDEEEGE